MPRYRLTPTPEQAQAMVDHCAHAWFLWNLAVEQHQWWRPGRASAPRYLEQAQQLTDARGAYPWLRSGSQTVQQQALRDFAHAMSGFFAGTHKRPRFRKAGRRDGFRIVAVKRRWRRLSRRVGQVWVPKVGWVRFRWSRPVPDSVKSYRVTLDRAGLWHVAFAAIPAPVPAPGNGAVVGVDRGVAVSAALSTGELLSAPILPPGRAGRLRRLQRRLARAQRGSNRRQRIKTAIARLTARDAAARKDWAEKVSTSLARRFDLIRVEDLNMRAMVRSARGSLADPGRNVRQKSGLYRGILTSAWGMLALRLTQKAASRVEKINPAFTSQRCSACGHVAADSRKSQALFCCVTCRFTANADVNAAINIAGATGDLAAGRAVTVRGGAGLPEPANREPQLVASLQ